MRAWSVPAALNWPELFLASTPLKKEEVRLYGQPVKPQSPNQMVKRGMGLLPEDRKQYGLALRNSVAHNTVMASLRQRFPKGIISERKIHELAGTYVEKLHIATPTCGAPWAISAAAISRKWSWPSGSIPNLGF